MAFSLALVAFVIAFICAVKCNYDVNSKHLKTDKEKFNWSVKEAWKDLWIILLIGAVLEALVWVGVWLFPRILELYDSFGS